MKIKYELNISNTLVNFKSVNGDWKLDADAFSLNHVGYWLSHSSTHYITDEDKESLNINFKNKKTFVIQDKKLYRYPKLDLPRQKVDLLKEKYNVKVIRDPAKADIHIISDVLISSMFEKTWRKSSTVAQFHSFIEDLKKRDLLTENAIKKTDEIFLKIDDDSMIQAAVSYYYHNLPQADLLEIVNESMGIHMSADRNGENNRDLMIANKYAQDYLNMLNNTDKIIYDTDVTEIIDEQLATIDNTEFETMQKMVACSDKGSRSLALEMLANCNIDKSFDVVANIFYWEYDWLKDTTNWNTVNVKALRKRMEYYAGGPHTYNVHSYNAFITKLIKDNKLTKFSLDKTREKLYEYVLGSLVGKSAEVFDIPLESLNLKGNLMEKIITHD